MNYDTIYAGLGKLLAEMTSQTLTETPGTEMDRYLPHAGRVVIRSAAGSAPRKKDAVPTTVEPLTGDGAYLRPNGEKYFARKWGEHSDVEVLRKSRARSHYVLLYGAPGCGKTAMVEAAFGDELETVLGTGDTEVSDLVGGYVQTASGGFEWVDGPLLRAAEHGRPLLIDEIGIIDPKVLTVVYGLMDGRREYTVTANPERGTVKAKDGFYVIGATNPNAPGVNLSEALLSRFGVHAEMTTDWSLAKKLGVPDLAVRCAQNLAKRRQSDEVSWAPQMRELLKFKELAEDFGTDWAVSNLVAAAPEIDRPVVADAFTRVFGQESLPAKI
jgi:hypothetical protein